MTRLPLLLSTALASLLLALPAVAQDDDRPPAWAKQAGDIMVRGRAVGVLPMDGGDVLLRATGADTGLDINDITSTVVPELDFTYFITDQIAAELILGTTPHYLGADTGIDLGRVWLLPPTLTAQWHPLPDQRISPYVGAGVNYTIFYGENASSNPLARGLAVDNAFGVALQAGVDVHLTGNWWANVDVKKLFLRTDATTDVLRANNVKVDPWLVGAGIGYKF